MLALPLKSYAVDQLGLDSVANFAVYANGALTVNGSSTTVNGDVGLGPNGTQNFSTGFNINGTYLVDDTANNNNLYSGGNFTGVVQNIDSVGALVSSVSAYAASLMPTKTYTRLTGYDTITGNGGDNIINVGSISYDGLHSLTLTGGVNDVFVFNVANYAAFYKANSTPIVLSGGVTANHVLFNLESTSGNALSVATNITLVGTFIAPSASMSLLLSDEIYGGLFAGNNLALNSGTITADVFAVPEPSSFALVGITCLFGLGVWSRRRQRR